MNGIVESVSHGFWTLVFGVFIITPISIALKSYGEIKIVRYEKITDYTSSVNNNIVTTIILSINMTDMDQLVWVPSNSNRSGSSDCPQFSERIDWLRTK